ncbi:MAG TPA: prepilin-type N-terminal cleavage/methylation domain-containing protein [Candidatus Binatia bacterium]|nr:prepilin-type N-terminal cleavage/methylation domain-containing protein [Candidatus Binatia bacterium]
MMRPRRRWSAGFSLIEVLAALTLFALAAVATVALAVTSMRQTARNRQGMAAAFLAQQEMEHMRSHDFQNMQSETVTQTMDGTTYTITATVNTAGAQGPNIADVQVSVAWTGPLGPRTYAIESYFTDVTE